MDETFLLSNIAPQVGVGFNRHCASPSPSFLRIFPSLRMMLIPCLALLLCRRLGLPRSVVSPIGELVLRCIRVHHPAVSPTQRDRREMARREWPTSNPSRAVEVTRFTIPQKCCYIVIIKRPTK